MHDDGGGGARRRRVENGGFRGAPGEEEGRERGGCGGKMSVLGGPRHPRSEREGGMEGAGPPRHPGGRRGLPGETLPVSARFPVPAARVVLLLPPGTFFALLPTF